MVRQSILTNQIPRAQAVLRRSDRPEQHLSALRMEGLRQVFSCLQHKDLQTAKTLLINVVRSCIRTSVSQQKHTSCFTQRVLTHFRHTKIKFKKLNSMFCLKGFEKVFLTDYSLINPKKYKLV